MYLRFITQFINPYGELETGIFMALKYLRDDHSLTKEEHINRLKELSHWFDKNLEKPTRFSKGTSKYNAEVSLSWFKDSTQEHIKRMQDFIEIAKHYDIIIERIASKNPGYIVFEDEYQVSAVPFKTDRKRVK
ncbi:MAG: hypothetical protein JWR50_1233 [Mucilaginibacter sp.]|nr:hypothetical protein [Mucilaginibacter sp.]